MGRELCVDMYAGVECNARRFSDDGLANVGIEGAPPSKAAPATSKLCPSQTFPLSNTVKITR